MKEKYFVIFVDKLTHYPGALFQEPILKLRKNDKK